MKDLKIKICGITDLATANFCINKKVNYLGFVFYEPSPRNISIDHARLILEDIGNKINKVAVTKDPSDSLLFSLESLSFEYLQVHGNISIERLQVIKKIINKKIIMSFNINDQSDLDNVSNYENLSDFFLFDSESSGSGIKFDWSLLNRINSKNEYFLSGGLNSENLKSAINNVNTHYFDISSGVEKTTGVKDTSKIADIMKIANG
tara:strand:- start:341 stop:958 length:618 start_codon:yes stop_codon:yes gene_type:complete